MRRYLATIIVSIMCLALPCMAVEADTGTEQLGPVLDVQREIRIEYAGITWMSDEFTLRAPPGENVEIRDFWMGFHPAFTSERQTFEVWQGSSWTLINFDEKEKEGFNGYEISLPSPVTLTEDEALRFRASYLFINLVSEGQDLLSAWLPVYPSVTYNISSFELHIDLPFEAEYEYDISDLVFTNSTQDGMWTLDHESVSISAFANENVTVSYAPAPGDEYILDCERLERKITVKQGSMRIDDGYIIVNTGAPKNLIRLKLPLEASDIKARDGVGPLQISSEEGEAHIDARVSTRWYMMSGDRWGFTVSYTVPRGEHVTTTGGVSTLTYPNNDFPFYARELVAVVTRPESESLSLEYGALLSAERPEIVVDLPSASIMPTVRPVAILLVAAVAIGASVILRRREPPKEKKVIKVEAPNLSDFVVQSRERIALLREVESLEQELEEGKIGREQFEQRTVGVNRRLGELTRSLRQLGRTLESEDPDLVERLREIRGAEGELERISQDMRNLDVRLRARRVSRKDYERRRRERLRRRSQAIKRIERALESLGSRG
jgi:hypothetical protein